MYLSKLELHGFKSFADRTAVQFDPGITVIVGPNGCGKSNIVDAVRWVIGEQRARVLRSDKMDNVIFNGTAKRRPLGMSEVMLTIENTRGVLPTEYTEVTLGRRLYRSGDSEYLLNGVQCRLKDITDLFMDTGMGAGAYSVIELKMIEEILSDHAQDRRRLFEEAAGITKYKLRRRQTLSKLDSTQADLTRLRDLVDEIEKQVRSLKRQAGRAERYKEAEARLHRLELALAQVEYDRQTRQRQALEAELASLQEQLADLAAQEEDAETRHTALRDDLAGREQALAERQRQLNAHLEAVRSLEADQRLQAERRGAAERERQRIDRELSDLRARRRQLGETTQHLQAEIDDDAAPALTAADAHQQATQAERDAAQARLQTQRTALQAARADERAALEARDALLRAADRLTGRLDLLAGEASRVTAQREALDDDAGEAAARAAHAERQLADARAAADEARAARDQAEAEQADRQAAVAAADDARRALERRRDAVAAETQVLESLLSSYEEFSEAVQYLATEGRDALPELRTVADVLACDERDRLALDAALGELASCIVVPDAAAMHDAVARLRAAGKGRATFIVLNRLTAPPGAMPDAAADVVPLRTVVRADEGCAPLADVLLYRAFLADTLDEAAAFAADHAAAVRCFARTGEWSDARGLLHGGSQATHASPAAGRLGRREQYDAARQQLADLDRDLAAAQSDLDAARAALAAVPFADRRRALDEARRALADAEKTQSRAGFEAEALTRRRQEQADRIAQIQTEREAVEADLAARRDELDAAEARVAAAARAREAAEAAFQEAEAEGRGALDRYNEAHIAAVQARHRTDTLRRDLERATRSLADVERRIEGHTRRLAELDEGLAAADETAADLSGRLATEQGRRAALDDALAAATAGLRETKEALAAVEAALRDNRRQREQHVRDENQRAIRVAELQTRTDDLVRHLDEDFGVDLRATRIDVEPDFDEQQARRDVRQLREDVRKIGPVNALALDAYEEEKERLDFLTEQLSDLEGAEQTLLETIDEINTTAAQRFNETFEAVQANFSRLFVDLFGDDAAAQVSLADASDPLESDIVIKARPRGKRPSTLAQLSGGEKTLTAIALLFAIYLVKPSPFCILDEVDAPLDDANVARFMNLLHVFSEDTQFILVTHNKKTMEAAHRMYGITMQEQGVSQLVGVKFDEAMELAEPEA